MNIRLEPMTKEQCRHFFQGFTHDMAVFAPDQPFYEYQYTQEKADAYWEKNQAQNRIYLAILHCGEPVGEVIFKKIDPERRCCTLSIHMKNDSVKNRGYGTEAERQALIYARQILEMETVYADTLIKNKRSQHVLQKNGFQLIKQDASFCYYKRTLK